MKTYAASLIVLILLVGAASLSACSSPDPIAVYVTPTPAPAEPVRPTSAASTTLAGNGAPEATQSTPLPTPPGVSFGPIVGEDYTPEPRYTPLPSIVQAQPCRATVTAPGLTVYARPDAASDTLGIMAERETVIIDAIQTADDGALWANTPVGWIVLDGGDSVQLADLRACAILEGSAPDVTLAGLHIVDETSAGAVLSFVRRLANLGKPVGTVKGLTGTEGLLNAIKTYSPDTVVVYRASSVPVRDRDCPIEPGAPLPDPVGAARAWIERLAPAWDAVQADYYELVNECAAPLDWQAQFSIEAMRLANERQTCLLLFSFPGGSPDMASFNDLLPAYEYALAHPCQPGRTHGIALHAYSIETDKPVSETDVWIGFRHRILRERLLLALPEAAALPVYITEAVIDGGTQPVTCDLAVRDALQYTYQLEEDPYVQGFHLWSVGSSTAAYDISGCLPALADALIAYYGLGS